MSATLKKTAQNRQIKRVATAQRKRLAAAAKARQQEERDEKIVPNMQRVAILGRDGEVVRGARLERDGNTFRRANPIRTMVKRSGGKDKQLFFKRHADACDRLLAAFEEAGGGITHGVSNYEQRASSTPMTGMISDATIRAVHRQIQARTELEAVRTRLGPRWGCVYSIVLQGIFIDRWGAAAGMSSEAAAGFLACSLDQVCEVLEGPERRSKIRSVDVLGLEPLVDAE